MTPGTLKNKYYLMRHGRSLANEEGIIISDPSNGCSAYGLAPAGRRQISDTLKSCPYLGPETLIYCSDFLRTRESAELAASLLGTEPPRASESLRERNFGQYEKTADVHYREVWEKDAMSGQNKDRDVESPDEVRSRFLSFLSELEQNHSGKKILLISHGDILQIALTWPEGIEAKDHRLQKHLETAEIRLFNPR
ncbi:MAG: histidine phosphatase family protein [Spirochaetales bacterium]|nr:histidine phosphatase family protein [Spirochaetales bacterium]